MSLKVARTLSRVWHKSVALFRFSSEMAYCSRVLSPWLYSRSCASILFPLCPFLFSCQVVSNSLRPHGLQHTRPFCPSLSPGICSDSYLLSRWCCLTISFICLPFLLLPSVFASIGVFSSESLALWIRWPKYWSFSFSVSPSNEYSGLISFRIDWFHLAVQGTPFRASSTWNLEKLTRFT